MGLGRFLLLYHIGADLWLCMARPLEPALQQGTAGDPHAAYAHVDALHGPSVTNDCQQQLMSDHEWSLSKRPAETLPPHTAAESTSRTQKVHHELQQQRISSVRAISSPSSSRKHRCRRSVSKA